MRDLAIFFVFTIIMLIFMAYPAILIVGYLEKIFKFSMKTKNILVVVLDIVLSILVAIFLKFY